MNVLFLTIIVLVLLLSHLANLRLYLFNTNLDNNFYINDNSSVPLLNPPKEIIINENDLSCHSTPTVCNSNADCQICMESLASCQEFYDIVILELDDNNTLIVNPGDRYCLALDNRSARSCNPHTGTWVLRHVDNDNFALVCHCDMPGLVTQLNIYDDCTFPVGCKPHGVILNIYTTPLTCLCENGFVSSISSTNTPYCRPMVMRDVMLNLEYFHRPPCRDGFLPAEHAAFDPSYRRQIGANICLPDPCSIDYLTGEVHDGRVLYEPNGGADGGPLVMCQCNVGSDIYPVYNMASMLNAQYSEQDWDIANACIKPLLVSRRDVRSDLKVFWGRNSLKSDADMVFQVNESQVHQAYRVLLSKRLTAHPTVSVSTSHILKFKINSAYVSSSSINALRDVYQGYWHLSYLRTGVNSCPLPGIGQCRNPQTCGNVTCSYNPCIASTAAVGYRNTCYLFRAQRTYNDVGTIGQLCIWNSPTFYENQNIPVTFYMNALGTTDGGYGVTNDVRTLYFTSSGDTVSPSQYNNVMQLLATYPHYSS